VKAGRQAVEVRLTLGAVGDQVGNPAFPGLQPRGLPAALGGGVALVETLIHHQDIRRVRRMSARWRRIRGLRLTATDLGFAAGAGPQVLVPVKGC
jgi:hypothetical protein